MTDDIKIWKTQITAALSLEQLERALADSLGLVLERGGNPSHTELHRVDVIDEETLVFLSGNRETVDCFAKCLQVAAPKAKTSSSESSAKELLSPR